MKWLTLLIVLTTNSYAHYGAKYEPPDGNTYNGVGWHVQSQIAYSEMLPDTLQPLIFQMMSDLPGFERRGGMTVESLLRGFRAQHIKQETQYIELSTHFKREGETVDEQFLNRNDYDGFIDTLAIAFREYGRPIFFRIAYEVNGGWNDYHPWILPQAYRKLVLGLRERGADNFATVWCYEPDAPADFADSTDRGWKWYPGDDVVDWFGLDPFDVDHFDPDLPDSVEQRERMIITKKGKTEKFMRFAEERGKPVFLSELSARRVWITPHDEEVDSTHGEVDWEYWFEPFFEFLENHPAIKAFNYINLEWTRYEQWEHWGDARLQINEYIRDHWIEQMSDARYLHAGYEIPLDDEEEPPLQGQIVWTSASVADKEAWLTEDDQWSQVLESIDVFGIHENALANREINVVELLVEFQQRTGKAIGIEAGGLRMHYGQADTCGETAARRELAKYGRIVQAGGSVDYLNLDSPIGYMLESNDGPYTPSEAARELADYIEIVDAAIPGMSIGINEPIPWYSVDEFPSHPAQDRGDLLEILDVLMDTLRVRGLSIDYFNCDCPYDYTVNRNYNGFAKLIRIQEWCHENNLRFGVMYNSARGGARSDSLFYADVISYYNQLADSGCIPENLLVWSWYDHPTNALPEDEPYTFTYTMRDFMDAAGMLAIEDEKEVNTPQGFSLEAYPNPFNSSVKISYSVVHRSLVSVKLYSLTGAEVWANDAVFNGVGIHQITINGDFLASGIYFVKVNVGNNVETLKIALIR